MSIKIWSLFKTWRAFTHWWLNLFISIAFKKPIDWLKKVTDMTKIANDALDATGKIPPTPPTPTDDKPQRKRLRDRIRDRRNKIPEPTPEPTPENSTGDYKIW